MRTFADYHREKMKDPAYKKEYDALEEWFQEELAAQSRSETTHPVMQQTAQTHTQHALA